MNLYSNGKISGELNNNQLIADNIDEEFIAALPMQLRLSREMEDQYKMMLSLFPKLRQKISELEDEMKENEEKYKFFKSNYDRLQNINTNYLDQIVEMQGLK